MQWSSLDSPNTVGGDPSPGDYRIEHEMGEDHPWGFDFTLQQSTTYD